MLQQTDYDIKPKCIPSLSVSVV